MGIRHIAAIDLGASSGRVMHACYDSQKKSLILEEIHRFNNKLHVIENHHCWNLDALENEIITGLNLLSDKHIHLDSIGIDTWGVDYVLLDKHGQRVGPSYAYRDNRTQGLQERVLQELGAKNLYHRTGIQFLPFNTIYQLKSMMISRPEWLERVTDFLMIPDYLVYRLTGKLNREYTNATTTQLVNIHNDNWDEELLEYVDVPRHWFGEIRHPGHEVGTWKNKQGQSISVMSVASHDTASAVLAAPMMDEDSAYLCSGTWSLMGLDTLASYTCDRALAANITNEGGIDGHYRVLKNIMGLWLFQRICTEHDIKNIAEFVEQTAREPAFCRVINPNDDRFLNPVSMTQEIQHACQENQQPIPRTPTELARCVFDSLALLYKQTADELAQLQQKPLRQLHLVGGGCQNHFLNQLCADVCQLPVTAGPIESSALGNVGCQLMALGEITDITQFRRLVMKNFPIKHFQPRPISAAILTNAWQDFCALYDSHIRKTQ